MVMEAMGHGRHVLWTYPFPGCTQVDTAGNARKEIERLCALHREKRLQLNCRGVKAIADGGYLPQELRKRIHGRLEELIDS
jgi:hypothetical protein